MTSQGPWKSYPWRKKAYLWWECMGAAFIAWPFCVFLWLVVPKYRRDMKRVGLGFGFIWRFLKSKAQIAMGKYTEL